MCVNVFVEVNFWLPVLNKNKIDVHWLLAHFRKGGQAVLIRGRSMISQALRAGVISSAPPRHCTNPLPVKHLITIKDAGIKSLIYLAFRSKITPALQATQFSIRMLCLSIFSMRRMQAQFTDSALSDPLLEGKHNDPLSTGLKLTF